MPTCLLALAASIALGAVPGDGAVEGWRYVLPPIGDAFEHPPLRALATSPSPPGDLVEKAAYRGTRRRYAQVRFGTPNSVRLTVVLDEPAEGVGDLYVDADRNRRIEP